MITNGHIVIYIINYQSLELKWVWGLKGKPLKWEERISWGGESRFLIKYVPLQLLDSNVAKT